MVHVFPMAIFPYRSVGWVSLECNGCFYLNSADQPTMIIYIFYDIIFYNNIYSLLFIFNLYIFL